MEFGVALHTLLRDLTERWQLLLMNLFWAIMGLRRAIALGNARDEAKLEGYSADVLELLRSMFIVLGVLVYATIS